MKPNKNLLMILLSAGLLVACNNGTSVASTNNSSNNLSAKNSLSSQEAKASPFNIYVQESMRDYKFALTYNYESSNSPTIRGVEVRFVSNNGAVEGTSFYMVYLKQYNVKDIVIQNHTDKILSNAKTNYLLARIDPNKDAPDLGAETNYYTSKVQTALTLEPFYSNLQFVDVAVDYFNTRQWVIISRSKLDEAKRWCGQNITILPDQSFTCVSKEYLLASVGIKARYVNPEPPVLPVSISVSEKSGTNYRNSLQSVGVGYFGLLNLEMKNTTNTSLQSMRFDMLGSTANFSVDDTRTTCKLDGSQKLAAGEACDYVIKYLPTTAESGLINVRAAATNSAGVRGETSTNISYSSY